MFYAHYVLSKKGPLAKVWLAAHWDKKLTKAHVFETDVEKTVDNIISPKVKMALRTSGHLLLGVVRIYSRKQKYLIQDLGEACAKIKMAFRPGMVDLPIEGAIANADTITLPEIFHDLESAVADLNDMEEQMMVHRGRVEEITLKEDFSKSGRFGGLEDDFWGDNEFGGLLEDIEVARRSTGGDQSDLSQPNLSAGLEPMEIDQPNTLREKRTRRTDLDDPELGFGDFGPGGLQEDILGELPGLDDINLDPPSVPPPISDNMDIDQPLPPPVDAANVETEPQQDNTAQDNTGNGGEDAPLIPPNDTIRDDSGFVLEPLDVPHRMRQKRKRRLVIDPLKELTNAAIRSQLLDPSDILQIKTVPPPTKKALMWEKCGTTEYLIRNPSVDGTSSEMIQLVYCNFNKNTIDEPVVPDATLPDLEGSGMDIPLVLEDLGDGPPSVHVPQEERGLEEMPPPNEEINELPPPVDLLDTIENEFGESVNEPLIPEMPLDLEDTEEQDTPTQSTAPQDERVEEFEQRRWNKRSQHILNMLEKGFKTSNSIQFSSLTKRCSRKVAASRFYSCLLLGKEGAIKFSQSKPFAPIIITKGPLNCAD